MNPKDRAGRAKPNLSIIPLRPLYEVVVALFEGAIKYGPWNWRKEKVDEVIYADAAIRHLNSWLCGEDKDPDSELPHISKAIAGLIILRDAQHHDCSIDTRGEPQNIDLIEIAGMMLRVQEKYADKIAADEAAAELDEFRDTIASEATRRVAPVPTPAKKILVAGGGSGVLTTADLGKTVALRGGGTGKITDTDYQGSERKSDWPWPFEIAGPSGSFTVTPLGYNSADRSNLKSENGYDAVRILS